MSRTIRKEVPVSASMAFTVPVDCTAVRIISDAATSIAVDSYTDGAKTIAPVAGTTIDGNEVAVISAPAFGRDIVITNTGAVTTVIILLEVN